MIACIQTHPLQDNALLQSSTWKHLGTLRFCSISGVCYYGKRKQLVSAWYLYMRLPRKSNVDVGHLNVQNTPFIEAVATFEPKVFVQCEGGLEIDCDLESGTTLKLDVLQPHSYEAHEINEQERLRRVRISKANKGNVPWNKGKKHSAETIQLIRERTKLAMQERYQAKRKLGNPALALSEETRQKIAAGICLYWQQRRKWLAIQRKCHLEWQNMIAEASRKGYAGEAELQWHSYKILDKQLKNEWLQSIERRKATTRPKGSKRPQKTLEQRKRISEAISAKWADPEYRKRVCVAISKYHSTHAHVLKKSRRKPTGETPTLKRVPAVKGDTVQQRSSENVSRKLEKEAIMQKRNTEPTYEDTLADSKLETIKKNQKQRATMETKNEAIERAK